MRSPAQVTDTFRSRGLKITPQRQLIFRILHANRAHPSADSVYAAAVAEMPAISLRTVYQTLNDLSAMGEILTLDLGTGSARFDPLTDDHHHLVCEGCGALQDVTVDEAASLRPAEALDGFTIQSVDVVFRGLCGDCAAAAATPTAPAAGVGTRPTTTIDAPPTPASRTEHRHG